ncbi:MAG TPA: tetratricopeptide repeat protein, partial [bacterium]|nr:tetratricopeptide repeat protein [bacterium]
GQADDALSLLKKAQELDPLQPQVQSLLEKVRRQVSHPPDEGLTEDSSVGADVEADFQHSPDHTTKKTKWTEGESLSSYFKASETVKTPPHKKNVHKKQTAPHREQLAAEADQTYNLGLESYRAGNYAQAQQYWQQTLDLDPTHFRAKRDLARLKAEHPGLP